MTDIVEPEISTDDADSTATFASEEVPAAPAEPIGSEPENLAPPLAAVIASIRSALAPNASPEARIAGASAARSILTVLEAKAGQPLTTASPAPTQPASTLGSLFSQPGLLNRLAAMSREQLLELLHQVTGAASSRVQSPAAGAPRFHLIKIPQVRRSL